MSIYSSEDLSIHFVKYKCTLPQARNFWFFKRMINSTVNESILTYLRYRGYYYQSGIVVISSNNNNFDAVYLRIEIEFGVANRIETDSIATRLFEFANCAEFCFTFSFWKNES